MNEKMEMPVFYHDDIVLPYQDIELTLKSHHNSQLIKNCFIHAKTFVVMYFFIKDNQKQSIDYGCTATVSELSELNGKVRCLIRTTDRFKVLEDRKKEGYAPYPVIYGEILKEKKYSLDKATVKKIRAELATLDEGIYSRIKQINASGSTPAFLYQILNHVLPANFELSIQTKYLFISTDSLSRRISSVVNAIKIAGERKQLIIGKQLNENGFLEESVPVLEACLTFNQDYENVTPGNSFKFSALFYLIDSLYKLKRFDKLIEIYERYCEALELPKNIEKYVIDAYLQIGKNDKTTLYLRQIRDSSIIDTAIYGDKGDHLVISHNPVEIINKMQLVGLTPYFTVEYLFPLITGARNTCVCTLDEIFPDDLQIDKYAKILNALADFLYSDYGIIMYDFNYPSVSNNIFGSFSHLFLSTDKNICHSLQKLREDSFAKLKKEGALETARYLFIQLGRLLKYPACCIDNAVEGRFGGNDTAFEKQFIEKLLFAYDNNDMYMYKSLFTFEFFPCSPYCKNAEKIGVEMMEKYRDFNQFLTDLYNDVMMPAHYRGILNCYADNKRPFFENLTIGICDYLNITYHGLQQIRNALIKQI